jgi:hypothetical protein
MAAATSVPAVASVAAASITASAGVSSNIASGADLSGERGNRCAGRRSAHRWAGYRLPEISVNEQDHDQEKYCEPKHHKACHGSASPYLSAVSDSAPYILRIQQTPIEH